MNKLRYVTILVFLFGSSAMCFGSHVSAESVGYNANHQHSGLERILKAVQAHGSDGNGQNSYSNGQKITEFRNYGAALNSGYSYSPPNHHHETSLYNNGYQYMPPNNGEGYHYDNPSEVQNAVGLQYGSHYLDSNKNTAYGSGFQAFAGHIPAHSSNAGYHYDAPAQSYFGNFQTALSEMGYSYDKPKPTSSTNSNFKGDLYLPGLSSSVKGYQYEQDQTHATFKGGYQYESPKYPGYDYYKPPQSAQIESSFKGQSYLPKPPTATSNYLKENNNQGYSYEKPSIPFK